MDLLKTEFTISDLEHLSGIKKHTIRIWEKRYGLLSPQRTETNIRFYGMESLIHLLNIALLNKNGHKISKIADLGKAGVIALCKELNSEDNHIIDQMKLAMLQFDEQLFEANYLKISKDLSFSEIYLEYFIPLLKKIGFLWQTSTINPSHEHFVSSLIKRKIIQAIGNLKPVKEKADQKRFVLFLPEYDMHDISLLYLNYELLRMGQKVIFLEQTIPLRYLKSIRDSFSSKVIFATYFTIPVEPKRFINYLLDFDKEVLAENDSELWVLGNIDKGVDLKKLPSSILRISQMEEITQAIKS